MTKSNKPLKVIPLGGLGEIGLNLMVVEYDNEILVIDCGVLFPDLHWLGLDLVLPDFTYLIENEHKIKGLVVTHGHEDHIGAIPFLLGKVKIPVIYCSRFAGRLITDKCEERHVKDKLFTYNVSAGEKIDVGQHFSVEFVHVTHSTLETFALAIDTPHGLVIHSGDFKFDEEPYDGPPSDKKRFKELGKQKPLLLLADSTNSERCGHSLSESSIGEELERLISESKEAVVVALFASNVHRVHQLMDIAEKCGRKVFLSGRSMERYVQIAIEENYLPARRDMLHAVEEINHFARNEVLVLSTGSQGEARSSLQRMAKNENRWLKIQPGDTVILSSRSIPGNEKAINFVVNSLFKLGAMVHYQDTNDVHVSGHAYQKEQLELLEMLKPRFFIPVHGEFRHLNLHARTARESGCVSEETFVVENGHVWSYEPERDVATLSEAYAVTTGRLWVAGDTEGSLDASEIKSRKAAARAGVINVNCLVSARGSKLAKTPHVILTGFLCKESTRAKIEKEIATACEEAFENFYADNPEGMTKEQWVASHARRAVRRYLDIKPLIIVSTVNI